MGLIASTAATNLFLDGVIATKHAGASALNKTFSAQDAIAQYVYNALNTAQAVAKVGAVSSENARETFEPTQKLTMR